jgi:hypothetical protein
LVGHDVSFCREWSPLVSWMWRNHHNEVGDFVESTWHVDRND